MQKLEFEKNQISVCKCVFVYKIMNDLAVKAALLCIGLLRVINYMVLTTKPLEVRGLEDCIICLLFISRETKWFGAAFFAYIFFSQKLFSE